MRIRFPLKELIRYSLALSASIAVFVALIIYSHDLDLGSSISRALVSGFVLLYTSAVSIALIVFFRKRGFEDTAQLRMVRLALGSLLSIIAMLSYHYLRIWFEVRGIVPSPLQLSTEMRELQHWQLFLLISIPSLMVYGLVHLLHNFILLHYLKTQRELEISQLRSANAETTNKLLRQQIQPHFLFNALNVLKLLIKQNPKTAEAYLLRLSDFLRSSLSQQKKGLATVREEVKLCQDYLEMQKMRFGDALSCVFDVPDEYLDGFLPFFSLQPLAENAIKHNRLTDDDPLYVRVVASGGYITVSNNLQRRDNVEGSTGNGLANLAERYRLFSGDQIMIREDGNTFSVTLRIRTKPGIWRPRSALTR